MAPHRPWFLAGAGLWCLGALWWVLVLLGLWPSRGPLPATQLHAWFMSLGFMPCFMVGFAATAVPRWLGLPAPTVRSPVRSKVRRPGRDILAASAMLLAWCGLWLADAGLLPGPAAAVCAAVPGLLLLGQALGLWRCCRQARALGSGHSAHAWGLVWALALMGACLGGLALGLLRDGGAAGWPQLLLWPGFELGLGGAFLWAVQRLTPYLDAFDSARPGAWLRRWAFWQGLPGLMLGQLLRCGLGLAAHADLRLTSALRAAALLLFLSLAVSLWRDISRAELVAARRAPMLAQLHRGCVWLILSLLLEAAAQAWLLLSDAAVGNLGNVRDAGAQALRLAALHALALGWMGTVCLAMVSRVTAVRQGHSVALDRWQQRMHALLQVVAAARVSAALCAGIGTPNPPLMQAASLGFAVLAAVWLLRYGPWLWRGRRP